MPVAVLCIFGGNAGAQGMNSMLGRNSIQMGINQYYYHYSEKLDDATIGLIGIKKYRGQPKSDEYGYTAGFNLNAALYSRRIPLYGSFIFEGGTGSHTYDGVTQTPEITIDTVMVYEPYKGRKKNNFLNVGVYAGPYFLFDRFLVGIQCGIEYHNWGRYFPLSGLSGTSMSEHYEWYYAPLKLQTAFQLSPRTSIGCNVYYKFMYSGTVEMSFGIMDMYFTKSDKPPVNLGNKQGFMAEFPFQTNMSTRVSFECTPWFEYRPFGRSNIDTLTISDYSGVQKSPFLEPASGSFSIGCMVSILFGSYGRVSSSPGSFQ
jgi:hypothetical protein